MGQIHHGSATTTVAVRRAIQHSQESLRALAKRHGINQKTVAKSKQRTSVADLPTGPKEPRSTVLTVEEEAVKRFYYESHDQLRQHLADFVAAYNFARGLKTLEGLTPCEFICRTWATQRERFKLNPLQQMPGPNT